MYNEIPRAHLSTSREIYVFTLCSVRFFLLVLRVLLEVLPPLQTGWEHGPLLWRQAWCWAGAMEELLLSMLPCVPWPSFLCACGCRRPKEERSRKLHFHSAEAVECSETKHHDESQKISPCAIRTCHLGSWTHEVRSNLAAMFCLDVPSCVSV